MRLKEGFVLRDIEGDYLVVPVGNMADEFRGVFNLNSSAVYLWEKLQDDQTLESLLQMVLEDYDIEIEEANTIINGFVDYLRNMKLLEE